MILNIITIAIFIIMFLIGFIPLLKMFKIKKNGVKTHAQISNVRITKRPGTRSPVEYTALLTFKDSKNRTVKREYVSAGDYFSLFANGSDHEIPLTYNKDNPNKIFLPKDKGDIGYSVIYCVVGLLGAAAIFAIWFL